MKKLFLLSENALLLACYRSRFRFPTVAVSVASIVSVLGIAVLATVVGAEVKWHEAVGKWMYMLMILQTFVLFAGTVFLSTIVQKEITSGTLELHRVSPLSKAGQMIGLLLGGPGLEWLLAFLMTPAIVFLGLLIGVPIGKIMVHQASTYLMMLMLYSFVVVGMLGVDRKRIQTVFSSPLLLFAVLWIIWIPLSSLSGEFGGRYDVVYCGFSPHALIHFSDVIRYNEQPEYASVLVWWNTFFIQCLVQVPIIILLVSMGIRKLNFPERPLFSKIQAFAIFGILLCIYMAELWLVSGGLRMASGYRYGYGKDYVMMFFPHALLAMIPLSIFFGLGAIALLTPERHIILKDRERFRSPGVCMGIKRHLSDGASTVNWLFGHMLLTFLAICIFSVTILQWSESRSKMLAMVPYLFTLCLIASAQLAAFSSAYEYFLVSAFRRYKSLFLVVVILVWLALPFTGGLLRTAGWEWAYHASIVFSPIVAPISYIYEKELLGAALLEFSFSRPVILIISIIAANVAATGFFMTRVFQIRKKLH